MEGGGYVGIVFLFLFLIIGFFVFVPLMIARAVKQGKQARNFLPDLLRMSGLKQSGKALEGEYKGFPTTLHIGLGFNYVKAVSSYLDNTIMTGGLYDRNTVYAKFVVNLTVTGANMPKLDLVEKINILRTDQFIQDKIAGKGTNQPKIKIDGVRLCNGRIQVFGEDQAFAEKIVRDPELQRLLSNWYYACINISGDKITLILDDVNVVNKYKKRIRTPHYMIQALDICARIGSLAKI